MNNDSNMIIVWIIIILGNTLSNINNMIIVWIMIISVGHSRNNDNNMKFLNNNNNCR